MAANKDFVIEQGRTFQHVLRWEAPPYIYKPITAITANAPARITSAAHGIPDGWRVAVVSVKGMTQINAANNPPKAADFKRATVVDANTIELNDVNSADYKAYTSGGFIQLLTPVDMTGFTARMSIKDKIGGAVLLSLTTANSGIAIDNASKTISLYISATDTEAITTWTKGVYDLELVSSGGVVTALLAGKVSVVKEVTTS